MRLDRKLLLIAPTIVLFFVVAGMLFAAFELHVVAASTADSIQQRSMFVSAMERGEKTLTSTQSAGLLRLGIQVEEQRTAAVTACRDLLVVLAAMTFAALCVLAVGIRTVPREHWPRFGRQPPDSPHTDVRP